MERIERDSESLIVMEKPFFPCQHDKMRLLSSIFIHSLVCLQEALFEVLKNAGLVGCEAKRERKR